MRLHLPRRLTGLEAVYVFALVVGDLIMLRLAFVLAYRFRLFTDSRPGAQFAPPPPSYDDLAALCVAVMMVVFALRRMYIRRRGVGRVDLLYQIAASVGLGWLAALSATLLVYRTLEPSRLMLVYWPLLSIGLVWLVRVILDGLLREAHRRGRDIQMVLIVGDGEPGELVYAKIAAAPEVGFHVVGFIGDGRRGAPPMPILGDLDSVP